MLCAYADNRFRIHRCATGDTSLTILLSHGLRHNICSNFNINLLQKILMVSAVL